MTRDERQLLIWTAERVRTKLLGDVPAYDHLLKMIKEAHDGGRDAPEPLLTELISDDYRTIRFPREIPPPYLEGVPGNHYIAKFWLILELRRTVMHEAGEMVSRLPVSSTPPG